jgi:iron complex outermembrane receptor protein
MPGKQWKSIGIALSVGTSAAFTAPVVSAQDTGSLEEIVVTARKRVESLQDVGLAVSALSQTEINRTFARDIMDLASVSPNLIIDDTGQGPGGVAAIFIRGIGAADVEKNFDPAVGVVVDGIFMGANAGSLLRSIDLARVEVLRGPQGTLFGRNTIGGLINLSHTQPTGELGAKVRAGLENYDTYYVDGIFNFGITDDFAAKLSLAKRDQQDGYYDNVTTGEKGLGANDYQSYGVNLLWDATENLAIEYTYQKEETDQDTPPLLNTAQERHAFCSGFGFCSPSADLPITGDRYKIAQNYVRPAGEQSSRSNPVTSSARADLIPVKGEATFDTDFHELEVRWELNDAIHMDYLYGSWESDETILSNWDGTPILLYGTDRPAQYEQDSHELRLTYNNGGALSFVAGAYLWESEYAIQLRSYVPSGDDFDVILDILQEGEQDTDSRALFFEADYNFTDAFTLTLGGRYTEDEKESRQYGVVNTGPDHPSDEWDEFTPRVGGRYQLNDDVMLFATYSAGYRSGGFNGRVANLVDATQPYEPETVDNYEVGIKSEWLDNRLRVNANLFYMDYQDKQEELQLPDDNDTGQKTVVENAASATIQGVELDLQAYITEQLSLRANLGYLDSKYDDFSYEGLDGTVDLSGLDFRRAPEWTGSLDLTYEWDMAGGNAWVRGAYHYIGSHFVNVSNSPELENDDQHLLDASVNYAINSLQFSLFGRNLTDEDGYSHGYDVAGAWSYAATRAPRTYGVEVVYNFGNE